MRIDRPIIAKTILYGLIFTPLWMFLAWFFTPKTDMAVFILDKTVLNDEVMEHRSFSWLMNYLKIVKRDGDLYDGQKDYWGFFPKENPKFSLTDLSNTHADIDSLCAATDILYYTDTYGIYENEWYKHKLETEHSRLVYGGLSEEEFQLMRAMKESKKLIITEFNLYASPTSGSLRGKTEDLFGLHWTGWVGRYFLDLDTLRNKELPLWLIKGYKEQHGGRWDFTGSGIVFVHENETIEILDNNKDLSAEVPYIETEEKHTDFYGSVPKVPYPFWFDVHEVDTAINECVSYFNIYPNEKGLEKLRSHRIPRSFPAVVRHIGDDYRFYYFAADFADNPIKRDFLAYFKGIPFFRSLMYEKTDITDRSQFFWEYYRPTIQKIMEEEADRLKKVSS